MNVIRINWSLIKRSLLVFLILYISYVTIGYFLFAPASTLKYDSSSEEFLMDRNWAELNQIEFYDDKSDNTHVKFRIKSTSINYLQIPVPYWSRLIEKAVKLGSNTIEIDIVWNYHEPMYKQFDYSQGSNDLGLFIRLVESYKMFLIVRIDPYFHCSDYDLGGIPSWLLGDITLEKREKTLKTSLLNMKDTKFVKAFQKYLNSFLNIISSNQVAYNGPIIGVVIENYQSNPDSQLIQNDLINFYGTEYASLIKDKLYEYNVIEILLKSITICEINEKESYYCDPNLKIYLPIVDGEVIETNMKKRINQGLFYKNFLENSKCHDSRSYKYWSDGQSSITQSSSDALKLHKTSLVQMKLNLIELLKKRKSFNIKNFYCGTNYGFRVGSHHKRFDTADQLPISTSFIHSNCLVEENIDLTDTFWLSHQILTNQLNFDKIRIRHLKHYKKVDQLDLNNEVDLKMSHFLTYQNLSELLPSAINWQKNTELYFEYLGLQNKNDVHDNYGYMLYRLERKITKGTVVYIETATIRDYALVICNLNETILRIDHFDGSKKDSILKLEMQKNCDQFDVLVENLGRFSDSSTRIKFSSQRKGILTKNSIQYKLPDQNILLSGNRDWKVFFLDFKKKLIDRFYLNSKWTIVGEMAPKLNIPMMTYAKFNVNKKQSIATSSTDSIDSSKNLRFEKGVYLLMPGKVWSKGTVFLNNFNLGRYWSSIGPLCTLFIPEFILYDGLNELMIFELNKVAVNMTVYLTHSHVIL